MKYVDSTNYAGFLVTYDALACSLTGKHIIYDLSEGITAISVYIEPDKNKLPQLLEFLTAVGYNARSDGLLDEKIYMYRFWTLHGAFSFPPYIYAGQNPTPIQVADKALTQNGIAHYPAMYSDTTFSEACLSITDDT